MDAARYSRMRDIFLEADELPPEQRESFVREKAGDDQELYDEVISLLAEHDPESAKVEGENAVPLAPPSLQQALAASDYTTSQNAGNKTTETGQQKSGPFVSQQTKRPSSQVTKHGAERTHASPKHGNTSVPKKSPSTLLWAQRTRQSRRTTSRWLWLAALLPTALVGWFTFQRVQSTMNQTVHNELVGVADTVSLATDRFLEDKVQLVQSWSRQPEIRKAILGLVELAKADTADAELRKAPHSKTIHQALRTLANSDDIKFVVWSDSYMTIASSLEGGEDVGTPVHHDRAANLARVMRNENVIFGPERLTEETEGYQPETDQPIMAIIVPVLDDDSDRVIAALMVRGFDMYDELNRMLVEITLESGLDAYAVNKQGVMVSESRHAKVLADQGALDVASNAIAARLRVADPGMKLSADVIDQFDRNISPLTVSVMSVTNGNSAVRIQPYNNYAGEEVVGAWRWNSTRRIGVVIERSVNVAFAPTRIVGFSFLILGSILFLTAFAAAAMIASRSARAHAAVHPLSRYEVLSELGSGGMGVVYRARHRQLGRDTALKLLRGDRHNKEDRLRFDREARLAASLSSPHSVMIYDYGRSEDGEAFCVMELLKGLTLSEVVGRDGFQPIGRVLSIIAQMCEALSEAHSLQLLHRDIKPQNVMLSFDPSVGDWAVVFDYGLAKPLQQNMNVYQTSEAVWAGTPMYMAPERFRAPANSDPRSDIYSVGCVAYFLLAGRPPFIECDPESLFALIITQEPISMSIHRDEPLPEEITAFVMRCMAKDPEQRFVTIDELQDEVNQLRSRFPWAVEDAHRWWDSFGDIQRKEQAV